MNGTLPSGARATPDDRPDTGPDVHGVRVLETPSELLAWHRLRRGVYGALGYLGPVDAGGPRDLEVDEFDRSSVAFGILDRRGGLAGALRLISTQDYPGPDSPPEGRQVWVRRLPSIVSDEVARRLDEFNPGRSSVGELSRLVVHPDHRGAGLSRRLLEFGIAYALTQDLAVLIGGCRPDHVTMYARYGYRVLPGTGLETFRDVRQVGRVVVCRTSDLPEPTRTRVDQVVHALLQ